MDPFPASKCQRRTHASCFARLFVHVEVDAVGCTQDEVRDLVSFAKLRGVRVVPELEMSTHSRALHPLAKTRGLAFCNDSFPIVLYDDPAGVTFGVLKTLLSEVWACVFCASGATGLDVWV